MDNNSGSWSITLIMLRHNISNCLPSLFATATSLDRAKAELEHA